MPIYKEVDELLNAMDTWDKFGDSFGLFRLNKSNEKDYVPYVRYEDMVQAVTGTPHADVAPVIHAHWIETEDLSGDHYVECSDCCLHWWISGESSKEAEMNYCPRCGARMDEEVE